MPRQVLLLVSLVLLLFVASACSASGDGDRGDVITIHTEVPSELIAELDTDNDGVVTRDALDAANQEAEREAQLAANQAALEAERAEQEAQRGAQAAAAKAVLEDRDAVVADFPGGQILAAQVSDSLAASPTSQMADAQNPTHEEFVSRLTSMLQLRLAAVALDEFGYPVNIDASDEDINAQVQAHIEGPFEQFAQQRSIAEDPNIERLATPHCVSALVLPDEAAAAAGAKRVGAGESMAEVAAEVNFPDITEEDGTLGCGLPFDLFGPGEVASALFDLDVGDVSEPILVPSAASPTGEFWVVLHLDDLQQDLADLSAVGPFAGRLLTEAMVGYVVNVEPALGTWDPDSLRISLPYLQ